LFTFQKKWPSKRYYGCCVMVNFKLEISWGAKAPLL
jgi:hypothetical protein